MQRTLTILIALLLCTSQGASAFWWSDSRTSFGGLDVATGYDANTVITLQGTIISPPVRHEADNHTMMTVAAGQEVITVLLGPWDYWEQQHITAAAHQEIRLTGSRAVGNDGVTYLFAQKLDFVGGSSITLRSETGSPVWSRSGTGPGSAQSSGRGFGGFGSRGGSNRGGGRR